MRWLPYEHEGLGFSVAESGEGRPIFFQHGLCGDAHQPAEVFPAGQGWSCLTLECRGHGGSEPGAFEDLTIATFTQDLATYIKSRQLAPVVIGGISMGAAIALRMAVIHPALVRALILARPAWIAEQAPPNMQPNALVGGLLREHTSVDARRLFEISDVAHDLAETAPDNLASLRAFFSRQPIEVTRELLCHLSADGPAVTREDVASVNVPTLVLGHEHDFVHPLAVAHALAALIPSAKLVEIAPKARDRGLYLSEFRNALSTFLKELS